MAPPEDEEIRHLKDQIEILTNQNQATLLHSSISGVVPLRVIARAGIRMSYSSSSLGSGVRANARPFEFGRTHVVRPKGKHEATIVWLHGLGDNGARYNLMLALVDYSSTQQALIAVQLNDLVRSGRLRKGSVVQLVEYMCNFI